MSTLLIFIMICTCNTSNVRYLQYWYESCPRSMRVSFGPELSQLAWPGLNSPTYKLISMLELSKFDFRNPNGWVSKHVHRFSGRSVQGLSPKRWGRCKPPRRSKWSWNCSRGSPVWKTILEHQLSRAPYWAWNAVHAAFHLLHWGRRRSKEFWCDSLWWSSGENSVADVYKCLRKLPSH